MHYFIHRFIANAGMKNFRRRASGGYTLLLAVLVSSIMLAVGLGIYQLNYRELTIASLGTQSQEAFTTASRGIECALYWDRALESQGALEYTIFPTSTAYVNPPGMGAGVVTCDGKDIRAVANGWKILALTPTLGESHFILTFGSGSSCTMASTTVSKKTLTFGVNTAKQTVITTEGYSSCSAADERRAQRRLVFTLNGEGTPLTAATPSPSPSPSPGPSPSPSPSPAPAAPPTVNVLADGVASAAMTITFGNYRYFSIVVPAGRPSLQITTTGGSGDDDFYVKLGTQPITTGNVCWFNTGDYTWKGATPAINESATILNPAAGTYYITVAACGSFSNITILGNY
jgi:hypothetical protein